MATGTRAVLFPQVAIIAGAASPGALLSTYVSGTSTPAATYQDSALTVPNANPVVADANGVFPSIFINPSVEYRFVLTDKNGANSVVTDPVDSGVAAITAGLALGTASAANIGVAGANVPLLSAANTFSGANIHTAYEAFQGGAGMSQNTVAPGPSASDAGYLWLPLTTFAANHTLAWADLAHELYFTAGATLTIPANATLAITTGNGFKATAAPGQTVLVAITTDTLRWVNGNVTGTRTITGPGFGIFSKKTTTEWWCEGGSGIT